MATRAAIGIVGCLESVGLDEDWPRLRDALVAQGAAPEFVSWDDPAVDWSRFDAAVIRASWNNVHYPDEYLAWADAAARQTLLHNPPDVLRWCMDKTYLADLERAGIAIVPTTWIGSGDRFVPPEVEFVVKPSVSAGGIDTARYAPDQAAEAIEHVARIQAEGRLVMVQDYQRSVDTEGETAMIFAGGEFVHAINKGALLQPDAGIVEKLWEHEVIAPATPTAAERSLADAVLADLSRRFDVPPLYVRVDVVPDGHGDPAVLEVELIDPFLFLGYADHAAPRLAMAIADLL